VAYIPNCSAIHWIFTVFFCKLIRKLCKVPTPPPPQ
jgi:hypothetical protein